MSNSSFPSIATSADGNSSPFIRLSPTAFFSSFASANSSPAPQLSSAIATDATSPVNGLVSTPKSHHRHPNGRVFGGSNPSTARKKLCYENGSPQTIKTSTPRTVSLVSKPIHNSRIHHESKSANMLETLLQQSGGRASREKQCQSAPAVSMFDNFSANVYANCHATPPRHSLRRQQSASATMVSVGGGRYIPAIGAHRAAVRFTPPIGEDVSALYAGSKFSDSPSAKSLPMPPSQWLEEAREVVARSPNMAKLAERSKTTTLKHVAEEESTTEGEDESDGDCQMAVHPGATVVFHLDNSSSDGESVKAVPTLQSQQSNTSSIGSLHDPASEAQLARAVEGIRLDPLQLIATVSAS